MTCEYWSGVKPTLGELSEVSERLECCLTCHSWYRRCGYGGPTVESLFHYPVGVRSKVHIR